MSGSPFILVEIFPKFCLEEEEKMVHKNIVKALSAIVTTDVTIYQNLGLGYEDLADFRDKSFTKMTFDLTFDYRCLGLGPLLRTPYPCPPLTVSLPKFLGDSSFICFFTGVFILN